MLRLDPPAPTCWFDLDVPKVISVRRRLYPERDRYRMLAESVTDSQWWSELPSNRPVLVIAEGLLMYLPEDDVRRLLDQLTSHYRCGELIFDGIAPWLTRLSRAVHWGIRDAGQVERWNPRLRCVEQVSIGDRSDRIPNPALCTVYRPGDRSRRWRHLMQGFHFALD